MVPKVLKCENRALFYPCVFYVCFRIWIFLREKIILRKR